MRVNISINDSLHRKCKLKAENEYRSLSAVITMLLTKWLKGE